MSTLQPMPGASSRPLVETTGALLIDSPVLGTIPSVRDGKLFALVGGRAEDLDAAVRCWKKLTRKITHMGPNGAGYAMKLAVNLGPRGFHPGDRGVARAGSARRPVASTDARRAGEAPTANGWFASKKGLLAGEPADLTLDLKTLQQGHHVRGRGRRDQRHRVAAVVQRARLAVGRRRPGLGRQGHRRTCQSFFREQMGQKFN